MKLKCSNCNSVFEAVRLDIKILGDESNYVSIKCPECKFEPFSESIDYFLTFLGLTENFEEVEE